MKTEKERENHYVDGGSYNHRKNSRTSTSLSTSQPLASVV